MTLSDSSRLALSAGLAVSATTVFATTAFAGAPSWDALAGISIEEVVTETHYEVKKAFPERLKNGLKGMELTGYAMPLTPGADVTQLILVSDMGICPFCGGSDHGASIQVNLDQPIIGLEEGTRITLRGDMVPMLDPETWQAATLENAVVIDG